MFFVAVFVTQYFGDVDSQTDRTVFTPSIDDA